MKKLTKAQIKKLHFNDLKDLTDTSVIGGPYFKDDVDRDLVLMNKINEIIDLITKN